MSIPIENCMFKVFGKQLCNSAAHVEVKVGSKDINFCYHHGQVIQAKVNYILAMENTNREEVK